jgi:hypothetical protein
MVRNHPVAVLMVAMGFTSSAGAATAVPPYNDTVQTKIQPQSATLLRGLVKEGRALSIDGVPVFNGQDKFLPGKIAIGLTYFILSRPKGDPQLGAYVKEFRQVAALTVDDTNTEWGIYYYVLALNELRKAGMLSAAVDDATYTKLRTRLDWRTFVDAHGLALLGLPDNYYGVALGIARLRAQMGWEDGTAAERLFTKLAEHYRRYSGQYGFSDETEGDGRFDRYSVLLAGEIAHHFIESDGQPPPEAMGWLRNAVDVMLPRMHADGAGFEYGRSLGPYGETAIIEVLTAAAALGMLSNQEKSLAYSYASRAAHRYADFWLDKDSGAVNLWDNGRRTDAYRGRFRRFGENLSLAYQFCYTNAIWNQLGYRDKPPLADFAAALQILPRERVTWFARGPYDRLLVTRRDGEHVVGLPLINGGSGQHMHSPYFPIPFSRGMLSGVADGTRPLLLPRFTLSDGSILMPLSFIRDAAVASTDAGTTVRYRQSELDRLGGPAPVADDRLSLATTYVLEPGRITRTDVYTPKGSVNLAQAELDFGSFSYLAAAGDNTVSFKDGAVREFRVVGMDECHASRLQNDPDFETDEGPMRTKVICTLGPRLVQSPLTLGWTITYR